MEINYEIIVPLLTFVAVVTFGFALILIRARRRSPIQTRLRALEEDFRSTGDERESGILRMLVRWGNIFSPKDASQGLRASLAKAGYHGKSAAAVYLGSKMFLLLAGGVGGLLVVVPLELPTVFKPLVVFVGATLLFFLPNVVVQLRRERRRKEIRSYLPDSVDLLEICVSAGMGLDMAWNAVTDEIRRVSTILADEMALTNLEMHLGASRTVAMRHMVERTGVDELGSLVAVLVQSERFGTSITEALRTFATTMREVRSQKAEEAAEKMAVKLLFPMVFFIFPAVLIVVAGPAGVTLTEIMGR